MTQQPPSPESPPVTYEIRLRGIPPESLLQQYPSIAVRTTRAQTVLFRNVDGTHELDDLLEELMAVGLVLSELHMDTSALPGSRRAS